MTAIEKLKLGNAIAIAQNNQIGDLSSKQRKETSGL